MTDTNNVKLTSKFIQQAFKKLYFEWDVEHVRPMENFYAIIDGKKDNMLSKDEFVEAVEDHRYHAPASIPIQYGKFVKAMGGFTRLTIKKPDGTSVTAKYSFGPDCHFFKSLGIMKAAYKAVGEEIAPIVKDLVTEFKNANSPKAAMQNKNDYQKGYSAYWEGYSLEAMTNEEMVKGFKFAQSECEGDGIPF